MVRDPATGKYRRTRLFVFTLGCSRKAVRLLVWKSSAQIWAELHERAFRRLGGTTRVVVPRVNEVMESHYCTPRTRSHIRICRENSGLVGA
jgi:hypothetical protein